MKIHIVDKQGHTVSYQGEDLIFPASDRERAEMILFLVNRNASNGPFELKEKTE